MKNVMTLNIAAAPLSWEGKEFAVKSKAYLTLGDVTIEREKDINTKEADGMIV